MKRKGIEISTELMIIVGLAIAIASIAALVKVLGPAIFSQGVCKLFKPLVGQLQSIPLFSPEIGC